ncbi:MAG: peptidylprolyl isomerase [Nitrospirota bacterium]|nr:peptidylprolyl isomerase [Nitrospirota bacterium]
MTIRPLFYRLFVLLLLLFPILVPAMPAMADIVVDRVVALVNNEPITFSDVTKEAEGETVEIIKKLQGQERELAINDLHKRILRDLVEKKLQLQEAKRLGIATGDEEVESSIADMKKQMGLDDEGLRQVITVQKMTPTEFRAQIWEFLTIVKLVEQEVNSKVVVTEKDIENYYKSSGKEFWVDSGTRVQQIFLHLSILGGSDAVARVMGKISEIQQRLKDGESFEGLAAKYSEDPSAEHGGDMGLFKPGELMPALDKVVSELKEGQVSEPVWSENGVHLVKVLKVETGHQRPLEEVRAEIDNRLKNEQLEKLFTAFIGDLRSKAFIDIRM